MHQGSAPVSSSKVSYGEAIREGFSYLLERHSNVFVIGQGLWSPWYVGSTMTDLDKRFGADRVLDSPVSELACTGAAVGASLCGYRPIVVHPRMDFMLYAMDAIVNQAAKWSHMLGGQAHPAVTIRGIVNRGGEQGAQHSQALHAWLAHIPGLRVVMPATVQDARDLLVAGVLCDDPVIYIDDRWLYGREGELPPVVESSLAAERPRVLRSGDDVTLVGASYSTYLCERAAEQLASQGVSCEVIDLRVVSPLDMRLVIESLGKTRRLCAVDGGWQTCGLAGEVVARAAEELDIAAWKSKPRRVTLPDAPAPTSKVLEQRYYPDVTTVTNVVTEMLRIA
jgi:acetoin:2,6-dichlorophenolindophenol oxidoreductase subunit beta